MNMNIIYMLLFIIDINIINLLLLLYLWLI